MLVSDWFRVSAGLWLVSSMSPMLSERLLSLSFTQPPGEVLPDSHEDRRRKKKKRKLLFNFSDGVWVDDPGLETLHRVSFILTTSRQTSLQFILPYFLFSFSVKSFCSPPMEKHLRFSAFLFRWGEARDSRSLLLANFGSNLNPLIGRFLELLPPRSWLI